MADARGEIADLIRRYADGPARLEAAFAAVPKDAIRWRPAPDRWSAHEVVCHAADAETNAYVRIRFLLAESDPVVLGYDQEEWARALDYHAMPISSAFATVRAVREHTAALLRRLPPEAWSKTGRHTASGAYSARRWLEIYAEHLENHARQIERNLEAWRAEQTKPA